MTSTAMSVVPYLVDALVLASLAALSVAVYGVIRMPGVYLKLHAASKAVFIAMIPLLVAAMAAGDAAIAQRALLIAVLLLLTTPISTHAIARATYRRGKREASSASQAPSVSSETREA